MTLLMRTLANCTPDLYTLPRTPEQPDRLNPKSLLTSSRHKVICKGVSLCAIVREWGIYRGREREREGEMRRMTYILYNLLNN